jgi:SAM-dependent methyltransferase
MNEQGIVIKLTRAAKHPVRTIVKLFRNRHCWVCGRFSERRLLPVCFMPDELVSGHGYTPEWMMFLNEREGKICCICERNGRSRQIARVLVKQYGVRARSLAELVGESAFRSLVIAELNQCAQLHEFLAALPGLRYTEYGSTDPAVPSEDVLNLSYQDGSFDLVLTSDTLEHVPDCERALAEIHRVLKPGGLHVFTIPVIWDQALSRRRAIVDGGRLVHLVPPVYHGGSVNVDDCLAFYDYGADIVDIVRSAGFEVELVEDRRNRALKTLVTRKVS